MIKYITKEAINGAIRIIENIRYTNGKKVRRLLDSKTLVPLEILPE